jgi:gliding motility-associated-like protein
MRGGKLKAYILLILMGIMGFAHATHYRAGEIVYERIGNLQYRATVITYAEFTPPSDQADRDSIDIYWGDGTFLTVARTNGPSGGPNGVPQGEFVFQSFSQVIKKNVYIGTHSYSGVPPAPNNFYIISFYDQNRMGGIINIANSVNVPFYVEDTLKFPTDLPNIGFNSSPILIAPPIDFANINDTFYHNPLAYDPDGDSLHFEFIIPLQQQSTLVPGYGYPQTFIPGPLNNFTIDANTGEVVWATPKQTGIYNIAILIKEYRNGVPMGTMIRDMQIIVRNNNNSPPQISEVNDTCVYAGDTLRITVSAFDPDAGQIVTLSANGGPFLVTPSPANFPTVTNNPVAGNFTWLTQCEHVRSQPYIVVFRAEDDYTLGGDQSHLVDLETWTINVIPPPPTGLTATATNSSATITWDNPYKCAGATNFRGFSVWRKVGCDSIEFDKCKTGLDGTGYQKLTGANIFTYTFTDNNLVPGQQYSYRVLAHFSKLSPNGVFEYDVTVSAPSTEVCVFLPIDIPVIINADVQQTDVATGQIFVRWTKPLAGGNNLDTIQNPPPYRFDVYRGDGFNFNAPQLITSITANSYTALNDTSFLDTGLNTQDNPYSYKILFFSNGDTVGSTAVASSVYLTVNSSDQSLNLNWQENVPWLNDSFSVFRLNKVTLVYDSIGVAYTHAYADTGLINDSTYCYYVKAYGHYTVNELPRPLINKSETMCAVPVDTTAPCPPTLTVTNDCAQYNDVPWLSPQFINYLTWTNQNDACASDIEKYYIYFGEDSASMVLIDSITDKTDTTYEHLLTDNLAGCYAITAIDRIGNESVFSPIFCIDNCPFYNLPNTFTPNGDGQNDLFHPIRPYRFVEKVDFKIFNRWGDLVFETNDPEINWDGRDQKTGKMLNDGVYLYGGYYYEKRLGGLVQKPMPPNKKGGGFIHLITGK